MGGVGIVAPNLIIRGRNDKGAQRVDFGVVCFGALACGCGHIHCGALSVGERRGESRTSGFLSRFGNLS